MTQVIRPDDLEVAVRPTTAVDHRGLWKVLGRFAGTLVEVHRLDDVLDQLGADMQYILGVTAAGVMVRDAEGDLRFTSTSDDRLQRLQALQLELDDGPCLLAYRSGHTVLVDDLRDDPRFPRFGPAAHEAGMASVHSFPMCLDEQVIGALSLYSEERVPLTAEQFDVGRTFASIAASYLLNARDVEQRELLTAQLQHALDSRVVIEQAKGFLAAHLRVAPRDAFELLRGHARRNQITVRSVAHGLLCGDVAPQDLTCDRPAVPGHRTPP